MQYRSLNTCRTGVRLPLQLDMFCDCRRCHVCLLEAFLVFSEDLLTARKSSTGIYSKLRPQWSLAAPCPNGGNDQIISTHARFLQSMDLPR